MTEDHGKLRISNADRDKAIEQLRAALDEGRIDLSEFDERSQAAYAARTDAELDLIFDDLPGGRPKDREVVPAEPDEDARRERGPHGGHPHGRPRGRPGGGIRGVPALRGLITVGLICTGIWFATWAASGGGDAPYFWPVWPILGLGIATVVQLVNRGFGDRD